MTAEMEWSSASVDPIRTAKQTAWSRCGWLAAATALLWLTLLAPAWFAGGVTARRNPEFASSEAHSRELPLASSARASLEESELEPVLRMRPFVDFPSSATPHYSRTRGAAKSSKRLARNMWASKSYTLNPLLAPNIYIYGYIYS